MPTKEFSTISNQAEFQTLKKHLQAVIVGQEGLLNKMIIALLTGGHILLEGSPGLAKGVHASFQRIQFTSDLMPGDMIGSEVLDMNSGTARSHGRATGYRWRTNSPPS